jgi:WD40 repeat protein
MADPAPMVATSVHGAGGTDVMFSPDGRWLASAAFDRVLRVFEAATGRTRWERVLDSVPFTVAFSPDGRSMASGNDDGTVQVLDATTGEERCRVEHEVGPRSVVFSPDGAAVAVTGSSFALVFDAATGATRLRLPDGPPEEVRAVRFTSAAILVVTGGAAAPGDGTGVVRVVDATSGVVQVALGLPSPANDIAVHPDGRSAAVGCDDGAVFRFDLATGATVLPVFIAGSAGNGRTLRVAWSADGRRLAGYGADSLIRVFDTASGAALWQRGIAFAGSGLGPEFSPDGRWVAFGGVSRFSALVLDATTGEERTQLDPDDGNIRAVAYAPDGARVAIACEDGIARVYDLPVVERGRHEHDGPVRAVRFSADGRWVATASDDGTACVVDARDCTVRSRFAHGSPVRSVALDGPADRVASAGDDGTVRVVDAATGSEQLSLAHDGPVRSVAFAPDDDRLATGSADTTARMFDAATVTQRWRRVHDDAVNAVAVDPGGSRVATAAADGTARLFDSGTAAELLRLTHEGPVLCVGFGGLDGRWLASGGSDGVARVVDTATGTEQVRVAHDGPVHALAFDPEGRALATASEDHTARVTDVDTGTERSQLTTAGPVHAVAVSADGRRIAAAGTDGVRTFDTDNGVTRAVITGVPAHAVVYDPTGPWLAAGLDDGTVRVISD